MQVIIVMIKNWQPWHGVSDVTMHLSASQGTRQALSMSQQHHQEHPREPDRHCPCLSNIIRSIQGRASFLATMWMWMCVTGALTTEIINQKQLHCTRQIAALPSVKETSFIYTSSLGFFFLIDHLSRSIVKGEVLTRASPRFPSGLTSCLYHSSRLPGNLHSWAVTVLPSQTHLQRTPFHLRG